MKKQKNEFFEKIRSGMEDIINSLKNNKKLNRYIIKRKDKNEK